MTDTPALSSSIGVQDSPPKPQPSRLQHSPSLPNIWFPPHSGPTPDNMNAEKVHTQRPSAPSSPKPSPAAELAPGAPERTQMRPRHVKYASIDPVHRKPNSSANGKTHARRRTDRDQPHLLTPPLTPSSSIRTSTSRDSAGEQAEAQYQQQVLQQDANQGPQSKEHDEDARAASEEIPDDQDGTRIILLSRLNRNLGLSDFETAIHEALVYADATLDAGSASFLSQRPNERAMKGINCRDLASEGTAPAVFFDVRTAKIIRDLVADPTYKALREALGEANGESGKNLTVKMVEVHDLNKTMGNSTFLEGINGAFSLKIQTDDPTTQLPSDFRRSIKAAMLAAHLKAFGSIRYFLLDRQEDSNDHSTSLVYRVEFHDTRDADNAYQALQGYTLLGMKLHALRDAPTSNSHSISSSEVVHYPNISTAGHQSQMRTRFRYPNEDENNHEKPDGQEPIPHAGAQAVSPVPNGPTSPTFFYSTSFLDPFTRPRPGPTATGEVVHRLDTVSPCYSGSHEGCHYCPSRGPPPNVAYNPSFGHYGLSPPPPTPSIYYPGPVLPPPGPTAMMPPPPPGVLGYEYMDPQMQLAPNALPWAFDPALSALPPTMNGMLAIPMQGQPTIPVFVHEDVASATSGRPYHHGYPRPGEPYFNGYPDAQLSPTNESQLVPNVSPSKFSRGGSVNAHSHLGTPRSSSPLTSLLPRDHHASYIEDGPHVGHGGLPSGQSERNQLNIARIEDGLDTRTTVMIKNIPNKMSDKDLTSYIDKVCPRKIDFLYLRMDFQNGCNVGYAFVNFIHVQDLLHFAKARLGVKWNMFSSEKVLQMSYANYQGKEALIEKFKNSAIMDERESWRPRIFFSSGPNQGLLEPFPLPTHLRRKERSSYNRGALFVPGINGQSTGSGGLSHARGPLHRKYQEGRTPREHVERREQSHSRNGRPEDDSDGSRRDGSRDGSSMYRSSFKTPR